MYVEILNNFYYFFFTFMLTFNCLQFVYMKFVQLDYMTGVIIMQYTHATINLCIDRNLNLKKGSKSLYISFLDST
jgi:hypothetical protein